jgi:hypothetical protein
MNSQELRALQEAYNQVCELDEGKKEFPHKKVDKQVYDAMDSGETAGDAGNRAKEKRDYGRADRMRSVAAKHGGKSRVREETDLFDYILEHLVAEGYADTNKAALAIMANMSEEWKQSILDEEAPRRIAIEPSSPRLMPNAGPARLHDPKKSKKVVRK